MLRVQQKKFAADIGRACNVSAAAVLKWEKVDARGTSPTLDKLACAAQFLGVTLYDLCDDVPEQWEKAQVWRGPPPARPEDREDAALYQGLARRLSMVREALGLSVEQFAAGYFLDPEQWAAVESGSVRPNVSLLNCICQTHDVTLDFLVRGVLRREPTGVMVKVREMHPELINEDPTGGEANDPPTEENPSQGERSDPLPFRLPTLARARTFFGATLTSGLMPLLAVG